jgi:regulator of sigma E protease
VQTLQVIASGLVALGLLVFVHELGHFLVAKAAGIRVLKFSLGFGSRLVGFKHRETEYMVSWLPLGGYVKMDGEQYDDARPVEPGDYFWRPWYIRILVLVAGPLMNLLTAAAVLGTLYWVGFSVPLAQPQVMAVNAGSPAALSGLAPGDVITSIDGQVVEDWERFAERLNQLAATVPGRPVPLKVRRQSASLDLSVLPYWEAKSRHWLLGITIAPAGTNIVERVMVGTPAEAAGLKDGDRMLAVEGKPVGNKYDFQSAVWPRGDLPTRLRIQRGQEVLERSVTPMVQNLPGQGRVGIIGVQFKSSDRQRLLRYPFFMAYRFGAVQTWTIGATIFTSLGEMLSGKISAKDSVGGPISIVRMAGQEARTGLVEFLFFLAGISVMLGVLNLLPIPILDGGTAVFFILEGILGHPVSMKFQEVSQRVGFALLLALMVFATYNDISKLVTPLLGVQP